MEHTTTQLYRVTSLDVSLDIEIFFSNLSKFFFFNAVLKRNTTIFGKFRKKQFKDVKWQKKIRAKKTLHTVLSKNPPKGSIL